MPDETARTTLEQYVQAISSEDVQIAQESAAEATILIDTFIGAENPFNVPDEIVARAVLEVGAELYFHKDARSGIAQFDSVDVAPARISRNPMSAAYPLLRPFIPVGLA